MPQKEGEPYVLQYNDLGDQEGKARKGTKKTLEVDVVIGADGANSRVAKAIEAGDYEYAIAFQERMRIPEGKMEYYKERAEMYVGEDVSPDFYAWVFPKYDHVAVGTGTVVDKKGIQMYQKGIRERAAPRIEGGEIIRVEAHPIPEHPRPWRTKDRCTLIGDAAGYVTKCSGEEYVQKVTFDSYLYKTVQGNDPIGDLKLGWKTLTSLWNYNKNPAPPMRKLEAV